MPLYGLDYHAKKSFSVFLLDVHFYQRQYKHLGQGFPTRCTFAYLKGYIYCTAATN